MTKRPMCLMALLLVLALWILDGRGISLVRGNPLPPTVRSWVASQPSTRIAGICTSVQATGQTQKIILKQTFLIYKSKYFPIQNVQVSMKTNENVPAGAFVVLSGKLEEYAQARNPGAFDARQYQACRHFFYRMATASVERVSEGGGGLRTQLWKLRERWERILEATAGQQAPMLEAIALGDRTEMTEEQIERIQLAGFLHIFSISGMHIGIVGLGLYRLLKRIGAGNAGASLASLLLVVLYGMMTGSSVSALRAVVMFLVMMLAQILGRIYDRLSAMALAGILILLESPGYLYDSGFLLSFAAVLGIGAVTPEILKIAEVRSKAGKTLAAMLGIQLATLPVVLYFYGEVSVIGWVLNLVILPTVPVVLYSGLASILVGSVWLTGGKAAALPGRGLLFLYEWVSQVSGKVSFGTWIAGAPSKGQMAGYYLLLGSILGTCAWMSKRGKRERQGESSAAFRRRRKRVVRRLRGGLLVGCAMCLIVLTIRPAEPFSVTCLDVGQGDAIVVRTPERQAFLVDCGSTSQTRVGKYQLLPYLKHEAIGCLEGIFVSHTDQDHINGIIELLEAIRDGRTGVRVRRLFLPDWEVQPEAWENLRQLGEEAGAEVLLVRAGEVWKGAGTLEIRVLAPVREADEKAIEEHTVNVDTAAGHASGEDPNEDGCVLEIRYGNYKALLVGDIGESTEAKLLQSGALTDVDFLKVGHHGSRYSSSDMFLETIRPEEAVISCAEHNRYGHPAAEAIDRLEKAGAHITYTMRSGAVRVCADGTVEAFLS